MPTPSEGNARLHVLFARAAIQFAASFGREPTGIAYAPGRVNLVGEHTDYNDGFVMPMAIDRYVVAAFGGREDGVVRGWSDELGEFSEAAAARLSPGMRSGTWFDYVAGAAWALREDGSAIGGIDLAFVSDLPLGAGLSSSAALEVAAARALVARAGGAWLPQHVARLTQRSEDQYVGLSCGIMDQVAVTCAEAGHALLLDCRTLAIDQVPLPPGAAVVVMDTGVRRRLVDSAYRDRAAACERVVAALRTRGHRVSALRDVDHERLSEVEHALSAADVARARHVIDEIARPGALAAAFRAGDLPRAGAVMNASHDSLRDLYQVSSGELDRMVELARAHPDCWGARMTGAGFGGCAIALVRDGRVDAFTAEVARAYDQRDGLRGRLFGVVPVAGAGMTQGGAVDDVRLRALERDDKWYLSCGDGVIWAPPFPAWLHVPGFWDEALVDYHPVAPLFSVALVDRDGRAIPLQRSAWRWRPDRIEVRWRTPAGAELLEIRTAHAGGRLVSTWQLAGTGAYDAWPASLVAFSIQPGETTSAVHADGASAIAWTRRVADRRHGEVDLRLTLSAWADSDEPDADGPAVRVAAQRSEGSVDHPVWLHTPFVESWTKEGLVEEISVDGISPRGFVHVAVAQPFDATSVVRFSLQLAAPWRAARFDTPPRPSEASTAWSAALGAFPRLTCSDPFLSRYYDYRLVGLQLNRLGGNAGHVRFPCVAEGIGYFHVPITYSAQCHMWEARWASDPAIAKGSLLNFIAAQKPDGGFHGRLYTSHLEGTDFYHANWGDAVAAVLAVHDDEAFAHDAYVGLSRYAEWLLHTRDRQESGLFDVIDQFETGQEYMSRYLAVDPDADRYGWENRIQLKGIDVSVYGYQLFRQLVVLARREGDARAAARWTALADRTAQAITTRCWDDEAGLFTDVRPGTLERTGVKAAVGFYPLLTDLVSEPQLTRLLAHLENPATFGTPWPLPSSSVDDPLFDATARWKGKRHVCPWNGRVWPMTTSHLVEGLLRQWHAGRRHVGAVAADVLVRFVRMFFDRGDLARPTCYEHYNPFTGGAAFYRGIDDYMHSWVADLLIRGVGGLEPTATGLRIDPLPVDVSRVSLTNVCVRGQRLSIERRGDRIEVITPHARYATVVGEPLVIS